MPDEVKKCALCRRIIPATRASYPNVKYCGKTCSKRAIERRKYQRKKERAEVIKANAQTAEDVADITQGRKGAVLADIKRVLTELEYAEWLDGTLNNREVARRVGGHESSTSRARVAALSQRRVHELSADWRMSDEAVYMLGPTDAAMRAMLEAGDTEGFEQALEAAIEGFKAFRDAHFEYAPGRPFITKDFHLNWMKEVLRTIYTGGRTMVLSPPRHGKSELLVHFSVWLIVRNPDIRILWIGPNEDIAQNMLGSVRDILGEHEGIRSAFLPPDKTFRPSEKGGLWARTKFTVACRTRHQKQPTMWCTGVSGRIHSLDCDFIVVDDPEDPDNAATPASREKTKNWFRIKVATRKMFWTGLVIISSRVHFDDLYSLYLESDIWNVVVDKAHDRSVCGLAVDESHSLAPTDEIGRPACVLFDELNPLEYLVEQEDTVGRELFEMMYLNQPRPESSMIFNPDIIEERCKDNSRGLGLSGIPGPYRLVAGLDPAARQTQAAFLWAVGESGTAYMVDLETQKAGGVDGAVRLIRDWKAEYGVDVWIIEDVGYQKTFFDHPYIKQLKAEGFTIRPTHTGMNKHDPHFGVSAMAREYHEGNINLPYGDRHAQRKVDMLVRELVMFTDDTAAQRRRKSDILMAHWFPWSQVIKKWRSESKHNRVTPVGYSPSFAGIESFANTSSAPWGDTHYPGR